ncbi:CLIP domain-containing serine protease HP8-like isoform X2 [Epargyreus clarus]|uniref:CLIP domain-containing serine protease HP8-like isoform X2 n=1 Tax=Epargyreus clarus TaxID=520877 RepID=UPI003C2BBE44
MLNYILLISVITGTVLGELVPRICDECVPVLECEDALKFMNTSNDETTQKLRQAYCGLKDMKIMICCSDFKPQEREHPNLRLLPTFCGVSYYSRLLGGLGISLYELPWMALISLEINGSLQFRCAGTVINSRYVLTAASCVMNNEIAGVRIGEYNLEQEYDCVGDVCENHIQDKRVEEAIVHKDYKGPPNFEHNIALLRVQEPIDFSFKNAGPICLPWTKEQISGSIGNKLATIAGWGLFGSNEGVSIIRKAMVPVLEDCFGNVPENSTQLCTENKNNETCVGDGGGPLMIDTTDGRIQRFVQYGILSHGPVPCGSNSPEVYTDVRKYMNWILNNIKE